MLTTGEIAGMRVLLIDNGTRYLAQLKALLRGASVEVVPYSAIPEDDALERFDAIILSGGHGFPVVGNEARLERELRLVKETRTPVLGICYGFEVIAEAFGAKMERMRAKEEGVLDIAVVRQDALFDGITDFRVFENHRWVVRDVGDDLTALAQSADGIEAIRHRTLPLYGVQFHPEMFVETTCGRQVFRNFMELAAEHRAAQPPGIAHRPTRG